MVRSQLPTELPGQLAICPSIFAPHDFFAGLPSLVSANRR